MLGNKPIKMLAHSLGFDLVGICSPAPPVSMDVFERWLSAGMHGDMEYMSNHKSIRQDMDQLLPGVQSMIVVGINYYQPVAQSASGQARIARYALGRDYHKVVRGKLRQMASELSLKHPRAAFRACVDSAPILEREYANRAGLGWFGKNTCLIDSKRGSWFLIGSLLTTLVIERDEEAEGGCGTCKACIDACPTGAIVNHEGVWQVDARQCISYLTIEKREEFTEEESEMVSDWTFGCDICQEVCPFNQPRESQPLRAQTTTQAGFLATRTWPNLQQLSVIDDAEFDEITKGSPLRRAKAEGLRRNALANLKNRKD